MEWETLETKTIHEDHWQAIKLKKVKTSIGVTGEFLVVEKKGDGAAVLAQNEAGEIALVSIYRFAIKDRIWQLPIENIEADEDPMHAAVRACKEELSYYPEIIEKLGQFYVDPGTINYSAQIFLATKLEPLEHDHLDPLEQGMIREVRWFKMKEIAPMILNGEIRDSWTIGALYLYKAKIQK